MIGLWFISHCIFMCWAIVRRPCAGLLFETMDPREAVLSLEMGGVGWRFDTPDSGDEHPKLVQKFRPFDISSHFKPLLGKLWISAPSLHNTSRLLALLRLSSVTC